MKIIKTDISSIFPIIIKIIKLILDDVNKLTKFRLCKLNISEFTVFVKARMASLKDLSNPILSKTKKLDKIKRLIKKDMKIKKDILTLSSVILFSELKIVLFMTLLGLINLIISDEVILRRI